MEAINDFAAHINDRDPVAAMLPSHRNVIKNLMNRQVETKLMYNDARRNIPEERMPIIEESISKEFEKTELDKLLKRLNVQSRRELGRQAPQHGQFAGAREAGVRAASAGAAMGGTASEVPMKRLPTNRCSSGIRRT